MYVIAGVTGNTGSVAAQTLLDAGKDVRVIVRNAEKGQVWKDKGADVAIADLFDKAAVAKALEGATAAYLLLPPDHVTEEFVISRRQLADTLLAAAEEAQLPHGVVLSSVGAELANRNGPIKTTGYLDEIFKKSSIKSTALRPGYFLENWAGVLPVALNDGVLPSFVQPLDLKIDMVATHDIGKAIADAMLNPSNDDHHIVEIRGNAQYSPQDIAQALSKALNKDVTPIAVPQDAWVDTLTQAGLSQNLATLYSEMFENVNNGHIDFQGINTRHGETVLDDFMKKFVA